MSAKPAPPAEAPVAEAKKPPSLIVIVLVSAIAAGAVGGGVAWFVGSKAAAPPSAEEAKVEEEAPIEKPALPAKYYALTPPFVVNLSGERGVKYLQIELQVMTRDEQSFADIKIHEPAIRNALLLLFSQQEANALTERSGKEELQAKALAEVQTVLQAETGKPGVETLLFTSFVMQ